MGGAGGLDYSFFLFPLVGLVGVSLLALISELFREQMRDRAPITHRRAGTLPLMAWDAAAD